MMPRTDFNSVLKALGIPGRRLLEAQLKDGTLQAWLERIDGLRWEHHVFPDGWGGTKKDEQRAPTIAGWYTGFIAGLKNYLEQQYIPGFQLKKGQAREGIGALKRADGRPLVMEFRGILDNVNGPGQFHSGKSLPADVHRHYRRSDRR